MCIYGVMQDFYNRQDHLGSSGPAACALGVGVHKAVEPGPEGLPQHESPIERESHEKDTDTRIPEVWMYPNKARNQNNGLEARV